MPSWVARLSRWRRRPTRLIEPSGAEGFSDERETAKAEIAMDDLLFARSQMAMSLAFHIVFAAVGIAMPVLMVAAEVLWLRTRDAEYLALTKAWAKGTAVLFAVGAVSGTVLSFELGLLFPTFMEHAGPIIGML